MENASIRAGSKPAGRPRSERARRDILEAAYKLLKANGFHAVGAHAIAAVSGGGSALARLRRYVGYVAEFLASSDGIVMARLVTGIHDDPKLQRIFLEKYVMPRRQMQRAFIREAIASGELKRGTDAELLIDALNGPLFFRWLQGHAPLDRSFVERLFEKILPCFQRK